MRDEKQFWTVSWSQPYASWPQPEVKPEPEILDLTLAREVLARIMAK
jgi:hypothetical protein